MKRELILLLAVVTLSLAMVPRVRRAVNLDDDENFKKNPSSETVVEICLPQTPCAWTVYKSNTKIIETKIINTYCTCMLGTFCLSSEEESNNVGLVHHCKPPVNEDTSES